MTSPTTSLADLAELVGGRLRGDPSTQITNAWPLDDATGGSITLIDHEDRLIKLADSQASAVLLPIDAPETTLPAILVEEVHQAFAQIVSHFRPRCLQRTQGIHPSSQIHATASLGRDVSIGPGVVIEERCEIGDGVSIGPNSIVGAGSQIGALTELAASVTLYDGTSIGRSCKLHSGVVLGADGFGYRQHEGEHQLVAQLGSVEVGENVEIGANTTVDRGVYGPTRIGDGTKIDNLVQIGHNCNIGKRNLICSQVGIAGSTSTGDYVVMAGQVGVRDHVHIGTGAILSAMAGVSNNVPDGATMLGAPATPLREQKLQMAAIAKLPQLRKDFKALSKEVARLSALLESDPQARSEESDRAA